MGSDKYKGKILLGGMGFMPNGGDMQSIQAHNMDVIEKLAVSTGNLSITGLLPFQAEDDAQSILILSLPESSRGFGLKDGEYEYELFSIADKAYCMAMVKL